MFRVKGIEVFQAMNKVMYTFFNVGCMCWEFVLLTRIELYIRYPKLGTSSPQFSPKLETKNERSR
jgi:hypothetical protein